MKKLKLACVCMLLIAFCSSTGMSTEPYLVTHTEVESYKKQLDDPRPYIKDTNYLKTFIPLEVQDRLSFNVDEMKAYWEKVVGFRSPDVVGKTHKEIVPGKYTLADKEKYPFKELMPPILYDKFNNPGDHGFNHLGNFTAFEIRPTQQYYWALPIAKATLGNVGTVKQDDKGYLITETWQSGFPFPRPNGPFKAQQCVYNHQRGYWNGEDHFIAEGITGVNKDFKIDHNGKSMQYILRLGGRCLMPPYGYLDKRAETQKELKTWFYEPLAPRDFYGNSYSIIAYNDYRKESLVLAYVNMLRRIRRMSSSDKQDQAVGQDISFDDSDGFTQTLHPDVFPYEYKVLHEAEYLIPHSPDGAEYISSSENFKAKQLTFERRPMIVSELKQLDSNYIYSKRIVYMDKETLVCPIFEMYDQKGRLYRCVMYSYGFLPDMGISFWNNGFAIDYIDTHSTLSRLPVIPAIWLTRKDVGMKRLMMAK